MNKKKDLGKWDSKVNPSILLPYHTATHPTTTTATKNISAQNNFIKKPIHGET